MSVRRCRTTKANVRPSPNRTERAGAVLKGRNGFLELRSSESPLQSETREGMDKVGLARKYHSETQGTPESRGEAAQAAHQTAERSLSYAFDVKRPAPPRGWSFVSHVVCPLKISSLVRLFVRSSSALLSTLYSREGGKMRYPSSLLSPCVCASVTTNRRFTRSSG